jgi:hypothetical protein
VIDFLLKMVLAANNKYYADNLTGSPSRPATVHVVHPQMIIKPSPLQPRSLALSSALKAYLNRLTSLQSLSTVIIFVAAFLQAVAIGTSDWFVLNVNEYIPLSRGGLWFYCYVSGRSGSMTGQFNCAKYENLPNFSVFINSRLYDSRVLLLCSSGFCLLLLIIEVVGIVILCLAEKRGDPFDSFVQARRQRTRHQQQQGAVNSSGRNINYTIPRVVPLKSMFSNDRVGDMGDISNSARFTTSIVINTTDMTGPMMSKPNESSPAAVANKTARPAGYFAYLAISLITLVGSVMDFVLKVSGFALFDSYINNLLMFNRVFHSYRSYSYWLMVISLLFTVFFWLFKVFSTRHVISLTKQLIETTSRMPATTPNLNYAKTSNNHKF